MPKGDGETIKTHIKYDMKIGQFRVWFTDGPGYFEFVGFAKNIAEANILADKRYDEIMNART